MAAVGFGPAGVGAGSSSSPQFLPPILQKKRPFCENDYSRLLRRLNVSRHPRCGIPIRVLRRLRPCWRSLCDPDVDGHAGDSDASVSGPFCLGRGGCHGHGVGGWAGVRGR